MAPIYTVGLATFLIVLGVGLSPLPQDSNNFFISRVLDRGGLRHYHGECSAHAFSRSVSRCPLMAQSGRVH
jgi:hypothetical protein